MNAKEELQKVLAGHKLTILAANIWWDQTWWAITDTFLPLDYTNEELENFYQALDFKYDNSYGSQMLFGTVLVKNEDRKEGWVWLSRGEYDESEWWEVNFPPDKKQFMRKES